MAGLTPLCKKKIMDRFRQKFLDLGASFVPSAYSNISFYRVACITLATITHTANTSAKYPTINNTATSKSHANRGKGSFTRGATTNQLPKSTTTTMGPNIPHADLDPSNSNPVSQQPAPVDNQIRTTGHAFRPGTMGTGTCSVAGGWKRFGSSDMPQ